MDSSPLINDLLLMLSALGSAVAGVMCGWQLRSASLARVAEDAVSVGQDDANTATAVLERPLTMLEDAGFLPATEVKKVLFSDEDDSFLEHRDPFASLYGEQPQGLSQSEIREVAQRLIQMSDQITADVDAHDAQLTAVSHSLRSEQAVPTMESVMAAVERLVSANETMQAQLHESRDRIVEQAHEIETAERRANTDALTRINNRRAFDRELTQWTGETPGVLALLDIDHFKKFNDEHGHRAGDEVLRSVAGVLRSRLESHCLVARYGGEEFGLVFSNHELEDVLELIESARCAITEHETKFEDKSFHVTCSLGVTRLLAGEPSSEWLQRADDGLYMSKDAGRNCAHCIDSKTIGNRETPFRLGADTPIKAISSHSTTELSTRAAKSSMNADDEATSQHHAVNLAILERVPDCTALGDSYRELLLRLGIAPVKLSVIALSVSDPEAAIEASNETVPVTRFSQLLEVTQAFCRAVDRVGYHDEHTLLLCMPGIEGGTAQDRGAEFRDMASVQLQIDLAALAIGIASVAVGDTFETMVTRAVEQSRSMSQ